ncbi:MAG: LuxR C-terminal-related transcriptional regulator [Gammaproteobacteria bacterium]
MPDWVIRSKLKPPIRLRNLVARSRLTERLDSAFDARLTLIHAPAGYGKSTCLAQWRNTLLDRAIPVAWLSFDEHDADLFQFLTYVTESCIEAGFAAGRDFPRVSDEYSVLSGSQVSGALVAGFAKCSGPHVLILDDFHRAHSAAVAECIDYLLGASPSNIHIVISTRELPSNLSLADLRIHDELVEIDQTDLSFSTEEIRTYLEYWVDATESSDWPRELQNRTEGWPVALQTVRRWASDGVSISETLTQLSGRTSDLADYFLEQVFESLSDDIQNFLLTTSILERVNGDLGSVLCEGSDGWDILQSLDQKDMFVQSLDRQRRWYRYHRLFSTFLQERFRRASPQAIAGLHERASNWFRQHGHFAEAVQHANASGNVTACAELLESLGGWQYALKGHFAVVQSVLGKLADDQLWRYPRLWLARVYLAIRLGQLDIGEKQLELFERACLQEPPDDAALGAEAQIMKFTIRAYGDRTFSDQAVAQLETLGDVIPAQNNLMHAARCNLLCAIYRDHGRFGDCMAIGDQAISHYRAIGSQYGETFIYFHEGLSCLRQGRLRDAESLYQEGLAIAVEMFGDDSDLAAIGRVFLAEVSYAKNRLHDARQYLQGTLAHVEKADAWFDVYRAAYLTRMQLAHAAGDQQDFERTIRRARSTALNRGLDRLARIVELQRHELALRDASVETDNSYEQTVLPVDDASRQIAIRIQARQQMATGKSRAASAFLHAHATTARTQQRIEGFVSLTVLQVVSHWLEENLDAATEAFEAALAASIFEGIKRPFIDEGALLGRVIREVGVSVESRRGNRLRDVFLAELVAEIDAMNKSEANATHLLSPREREVLRFVMQGQSNREIAAATELSVNTVKFHLKNVFEKLGVNSRKDAVSVAVRKHLI